MKGEHIPVAARTASPEEKPRLWDIVRGVWPNYDVYQSRTDRDIPVVVLSRRAPMTDGAFEGIRVVELAQWVFVPVAGALLADWGADVVRVDRPEGDPYRGLVTQGIGSDSGGVNLSVALANRGKRSIALDLHTDEGQRILHQLLEIGRRVPHQLSARRPRTARTRRRRPPPALSVARLRQGKRVRRSRPRCRHGRLRRVGVLGPRRDRARPHARRIATTRSRRGAPWATATAPWPWPSGSPAPC